MTLSEIAAVVTALVGVVVAVGGFVWWAMRAWGKLSIIEAGIARLEKWLTDIAAGNGPVCASHEARLDEHDKRLDEHGSRITTLEQQRDIRRRPA